jgi:hypothetical protein
MHDLDGAHAHSPPPPFSISMLTGHNEICNDKECLQLVGGATVHRHYPRPLQLQREQEEAGDLLARAKLCLRHSP